MSRFLFSFCVVSTLFLSACSSEEPEKISSPNRPVQEGEHIINTGFAPAPSCVSEDKTLDRKAWGWYRNAELLLPDPSCQNGKLAVCLSVGTPDEGWYTSELGETIEYRSCVSNNRFFVYFVRDAENETGECKKVTSVPVTLYRETPGEDIFAKAVHLLLQGVPVGKTGYSTLISPQVKILDVRYEQGKKVVVNFSSELLPRLFSDCEQKQLKEQIEKTLKYTSVVTNRNVEEIEILMDGKKVLLP